MASSESSCSATGNKRQATSDDLRFVKRTCRSVAAEHTTPTRGQEDRNTGFPANSSIKTIPKTWEEASEADRWIFNNRASQTLTRDDLRAGFALKQGGYAITNSDLSSRVICMNENFGRDRFRRGEVGL